MWDNPIEGAYTDYQLNTLENTLSLVEDLDGLIVEIGCWKGRSTATIANFVYPDKIVAVDTWMGNIDEQNVTGKQHPTVKEAAKNNISEEFNENMTNHTKRNFVTYKMDCFDYLEYLSHDVKFCHIDASHDYESVKKTIDMIMPHIVKGGVICGDDIIAANKNRADLEGGVERAVIELLPEYKRDRNFWWWVK